MAKILENTPRIWLSTHLFENVPSLTSTLEYIAGAYRKINGAAQNGRLAHFVFYGRCSWPWQLVAKLGSDRNDDDRSTTLPFKLRQIVVPCSEPL